MLRVPRRPLLPGDRLPRPRSVTARADDAFLDARPVLVEHCLGCHGGGKARGGLDVSTREALLAGGDVRAGRRAGIAR